MKQHLYGDILSVLGGIPWHTRRKILWEMSGNNEDIQCI